MSSPAEHHDENTTHKSPGKESLLCKLKRFTKGTHKSRLPLRHDALTVNVQSANNITEETLNESQLTFLGYSPEELACLMTAGGRSKRWAFCLTPFHEDPDTMNCLQLLDGPQEAEEPPSTFYIFVDPNFDTSGPSTETEVTMYVMSEQEVRKHPCGDEFLRNISR